VKLENVTIMTPRLWRCFQTAPQQGARSAQDPEGEEERDWKPLLRFARIRRAMCGRLDTPSKAASLPPQSIWALAGIK
jgi:hypothetical protein